MRADEARDPRDKPHDRESEDHGEKVHLLPRGNGRVLGVGELVEELGEEREDAKGEEDAAAEDDDGADDRQDDRHRSDLWCARQALHDDQSDQREDVVDEGGGKGGLASQRVEHLGLVE